MNNISIQSQYCFNYSTFRRYTIVNNLYLNFAINVLPSDLRCLIIKEITSVNFNVKDKGKKNTYYLANQFQRKKKFIGILFSYFFFLFTKCAKNQTNVVSKRLIFEDNCCSSLQSNYTVCWITERRVKKF